MSSAVPGMHAMHLGLERGVDHIVRGPRCEPAPTLPPERWLEPPATGAVDHLKALLVRPDLSAMLDESARPRLTDGANSSPRSSSAPWPRRATNCPGPWNCMPATPRQP